MMDLLTYISESFRKAENDFYQSEKERISNWEQIHPFISLTLSLFLAALRCAFRMATSFWSWVALVLE